MRNFNAAFGGWLSARNKEPRFVVQLEFDSGGADDVWVKSHADITGLPAGTVLTARTKNFSVVSQQLFPDEGRSTIGGFEVQAVDVDHSLTEHQRTALNDDDNGLRWKIVRFYVGFNGMAWADYEIYATQIVQKTSYQDRVVSISCNDVQRAARLEVLEPVTLALAQPISATDTTIPISGDTSLIELLEHDAGFTDAPSSTVAYVRVDDEIIRIPSGGISAGQFTSVTRGALGTRAAAHTTDETGIAEKQKKVEEVIYIELNAVKMAYAILTGNLLQQSATLPSGWHAAIPADFIDASSFTAIGGDLYDGTAVGGGETLRFVSPKGGDAKAFVEKQICRIMGLFLFVKSDGQLALRRLESVTHGAAPIEIIRDQDLVGSIDLDYQFSRIHNNLEIEWNVVDQELSRTTAVVDPLSQARWQASDVFRIKAEGLHGSLHSRDTLTRLFERFRDRYTGPPITTTLGLLVRLAALEVGDIVRVVSSRANDFTDPQGDATSGLDRSFEVQQTELDWLRGRFRVRLFGSTQNAGPLIRDENGETIPDAWFTSAGTDIESLANVTEAAGVITVNAPGTSFSGHADLTNSGAVLYANGDLVIAPGATLSISENVQLRVLGTLTINGDIDGQATGLAGVADTLDASSWPDFSDGGSSQPWSGVTVQLGNSGYYGSPRAGGGLFERTRGRGGSSSYYRVSLQSFAAPPTPGAVESVPAYLIGWNGSLVTGLPTDLRGTSGGPGGKRHFSDTEPAPDHIDSNPGGTGGAGGAGLLVVARGAAFGAAGQVNLSGGDGSLGTYDSGDDRPAHAGAGAGGAPGAAIFVVDGVLNPLPILTNVSVPAQYGATPLPTAGTYNVMSDALVVNQETRFGDVTGGHVPIDRLSFYLNGTTSEFFAGVAAARALYLAPVAAVSPDDTDENLAAQQDISLGITEAYANRFDPLLTVLIATITENATTDAYSHANIYTRINGDSVWVFQGPAEPSLEFELPADGNTYDIKAVPVLVNGVEAPAGEETGEVVSDGSGVAAVVWNNNIAGQVFESDDFGDGVLADWQARWSEVVSAGADQSAQAISGVVGGFAWQFGNNSGDDQVWRGVDRRRARPLVSGRLYRISAWVRRTAGSGTIYIGVNGFKGDVRSGGGAAVNFSGTDSLSSQHYYGANNYGPGDTSWHFVEGYFRKGQAAAYRMGTQEDPHICHPDVEYVAPMFLGNYDNAAGTFQLAFVGLDEMDIGAAAPDVGANLIIDPDFSLQYQDRGATLSSGPAPSADWRYWGATASTWGLNATAGEHGGVCATLAANVNGTLIASRFVPASNAERFFMSLRVIFGTGYNGSLAVNMYVYNASRSLVATVTMNNIAGPTTGVWVSANYSGVIASTTARFVRFALVASGGTAGTIAVQTLQASRQPFATSTDDPTVSIVVAPTNQSWVHTGSGWSPADGGGTVDLEITFTARRGSTVIATLVLRGVLDDAGGGGGGEGDISVSTLSGGTGWSIDYASTNNSPFVVATVTHNASGAGAAGIWNSSLPGESGVSK